MSAFLYDDLLESHLKTAGVLGRAPRGVGIPKTALLGLLARGVAKIAPTAAKAGLGYATGIPIGAAGTAGMMAGVAKDIAPSLNRQGVGPSIAGMGAGGPGASNGEQGGRQVRASLREKEATYQFKGAEGHGVGRTLAHATPYAAWIGAQLLAEKHPHLAKALSAGAYLGYAGSAAHDAITDPKERITGALDALALTAMLGSDIARWRRPSSPGAAHAP